MSTITLLSVDRELADKLSSALEGRVPVNMVQTLEPETIAAPTVIVLDRSALPPERSLSSAITTIVAQAGGRPIVLASEDRSTDLVLQAIRAGASDVLARSIDEAEAAETLSRLLNGALVERGRAAPLTILLGSDVEAAAVLATDLAIQRASGGGNHLLVDCTMPSSIAESYLDVRVGYGIAAAIADIDRLDGTLLTNSLARHEGTGLTLLTLDGGTGQEPAGIAANDVTRLLRLLRANFDEVTLCAGSLRHQGLLRELIRSADRIELLCSQSIRELGLARRLIEKLELDAAMVERIRLLVWEHDPRILLDGQRVAHALGLTRSMAIPVDHVRLRNALNAGTPLSASGSTPYVEAIRRIAGLPPLQRSPIEQQIDRLKAFAGRIGTGR
jgi:pilus assembly protein CpaE